MELKQLKQEIDSLPNIENAVSRFEKVWLKPIRKNTNPQYPFLQDIDNIKEINAQLAEFKNFLNDIKYAQIVNDKLKTLAHYLIELKLTALTNDHRKTKRLIHKFISDPDIRIKHLIFEIPYLESQLSILRDSYHKILENIAQKVGLENSVKLLGGDHKKHLKNLVSISAEQKKYISLIGKNFVTLTRDFKKDNEFRRYLKENS